MKAFEGKIVHGNTFNTSDIINMNNNTENKKIEMLHGGDVYRNEVRLDFSVNLNPYPMPSGVTEAIRAGMHEINQ